MSRLYWKRKRGKVREKSPYLSKVRTVSKLYRVVSFEFNRSGDIAFPNRGINVLAGKSISCSLQLIESTAFSSIKHASVPSHETSPRVCSRILKFRQWTKEKKKKKIGKFRTRNRGKMKVEWRFIVTSYVYRTADIVAK